MTDGALDLPDDDRPAHWRPAPRGYSWPPFAAGHTASLKVGHRSERSVMHVAEPMSEALLTERPELAEHPAAVMAWARAEARCLLLANAEFLDADGEPKRTRDTATYESQAARAREHLGLTPKADAELQKTQAEAVRSVVDLDTIRERGRAALASRAVDTDDDEETGTDA